MIFIHLVETRYTRVSASTHLSEWEKPKNIDATRDFDDGGNEDLVDFNLQVRSKK